ncbi:MAG: hypothetical protein ACRCTZ_21720 [Sarcina sp.]
MQIIDNFIKKIHTCEDCKHSECFIDVKCWESGKPVEVKNKWKAMNCKKYKSKENK